LTGTLTSPKATVPFQIERAAMATAYPAGIEGITLHG
jgi:hypothetical protein